jgi:hypothetical protein
MAKAGRVSGRPARANQFHTSIPTTDAYLDLVH